MLFASSSSSSSSTMEDTASSPSAEGRRMAREGALLDSDAVEPIHGEAAAAQQLGEEAAVQSQRQRRAVSTPPKGWPHFVAGGIGGMCGAIVTSPLDVVKTRLQSDMYTSKVSQHAAAHLTKNKGIVAGAARLAYHFVETGHLLREIAAKETPRALFKGLGPTLVGVVPARSINFYAYGNGKLILAEKFNGGTETPAIHLCAAALAGIVTATATNPIWVVKTRLQLQHTAAQKAEQFAREQAVHSQKAKGVESRSGKAAAPTTPSRAPFSTSAVASRPSPNVFTTSPGFFKASPSPSRPSTNSFAMTLHIMRTEGVAGLYRGISASYLGVAEGTIQWVLYEQFKRLLQSSGSGSEQKQKVGSWASTVGSAGSAKMIASLITYPHEVLRTRLRQEPPPGQAQRYTGLIQTFKLVLQEEGAAALYGGLSAHLLRVVPNAAIMFVVYETMLGVSKRATTS